MKNKIILSTLVTATILSSTTAYAKGYEKQITTEVNSVSIDIDGEELDADTMVYEGATYLPVRRVSESIGADIAYDGKNKRIDLKTGGKKSNTKQENKSKKEKGKKKQKAEIGTLDVYIDGEKIDAETIVIDGVTYLPLRKISESVGADVGYDAETGMVKINSNASVKSGMGGKYTPGTYIVGKDIEPGLYQVFNSTEGAIVIQEADGDLEDDFITLGDEDDNDDLEQDIDDIDDIDDEDLDDDEMNDKPKKGKGRSLKPNREDSYKQDKSLKPNKENGYKEDKAMDRPGKGRPSTGKQDKQNKVRGYFIEIKPTDVSVTIKKGYIKRMTKQEVITLPGLIDEMQDPTTLPAVINPQTPVTLPAEIGDGYQEAVTLPALIDAGYQEVVTLPAEIE